MFYDGHKYWLTYTKNNITYFRCARHKEEDRCPGRCMRLPNGSIRITSKHTHNPDNDRKLVDAFRKVLNQRAIAEPNADLHKLYWDEANQRHLDAAMLYSFGAAESAMRKTRTRHQEQQKWNETQLQQQQQPQYEPRTASEADAMLTSGDPNVRELFRVSGRKPTTKAGDETGQESAAEKSFYRATLKLSGSVSCWVFAHLDTLKRLDTVEQLHVDASLENLIPGFGLMVFHAVQAIGVSLSEACGFRTVLNNPFLSFSEPSHCLRHNRRTGTNKCRLCFRFCLRARAFQRLHSAHPADNQLQ